MNLPNKITTFRAILVPFFVFFMVFDKIPGNKWYALALFIIASFSDLVDGKLARKYNLVTDFGKFMDPLADKLLVCSAMIALCGLGRLYSVVVIIMIGREFIISGFRLIASDNGIVIAANMWGKVKTVFQMAMCVLLILHIDHPLYRILELISIAGATILTVISLVIYLYDNRGVIKTYK
jgi:CDP-diacylglycerol--glycerol-3-phosphate 3-phosphatidyltransferase